MEPKAGSKTKEDKDEPELKDFGALTSLCWIRDGCGARKGTVVVERNHGSKQRFSFGEDIPNFRVFSERFNLR